MAWLTPLTVDGSSWLAVDLSALAAVPWPVWVLAWLALAAVGAVVVAAGIQIRDTQVPFCSCGLRLPLGECWVCNPTLLPTTTPKDA